MSLKKSFKDIFTKEDLLWVRKNCSKNFFIFSSLVFFSNYFFVWAKFFDEIFLKTLPFTYSIFSLSIVMYFYFLLIHKYKLEKLKFILIWVWAIFFIISLIPII